VVTTFADQASAIRQGRNQDNAQNPECGGQ
jgi:hypothetical protein